MEKVQSLDGGNYNCKDWQGVILVIEDLLEMMKVNTQHGNFECAVLNLGGNKETKCLLNSIRIQTATINNFIHDSIDQILLYNDDLIPPGSTAAQDKLKSINDNIDQFRVNSDNEPEIKTVDQFREGLEEMEAFDKRNTSYTNNPTRTPTKFPASLTDLKEHVGQNLLIETKKIISDRPPLTGIFGV